MADEIIAITYPHKIGRAEARNRAEAVLASITRKNGIIGSWGAAGTPLADTFTVTMPAKGKFVVSDTSVHVNLTLGFIIAKFRRDIETTILSELQSKLA